jgi:predicted Ser/Thr protein kinase
MSVMVGQQVSHYRITGRIAEGGMGEVYAAQDLTLNRRVALKFLLPTQLVDEQARKRLLREAQAAAGLDHPFVCKVYEVGEEAGRPFIAMEYVDGTTLKERIERERLPLDEVLRLASEIAEGVEAAHSKGIVHRDLKPANVMVGLDGHVKVMDFGVAKRLNRVAGDNATATGIWADGETSGTLNYMSPDQLRGLPVDARSDVFAFGVILYEMLTGTHPFARATAMATASAILNEPAPPLGPYLDQPQPVLEHILVMALAKNPDKRHQSLRETRLELNAVANAVGGPTRPAPGVRAPWRSARARRWLVGAGLVLAAAVGIGRWGDRLPFGVFQPSLAFKERDWILIADVDNLTGDPVFDRSLRLALEVGIAQSKYVNVLPRDRLPGLLRQMQQQNVDRIDDTLAANIALRDGHVRAVLGCTIAQIGNTYSLTARLIDPTTRVAVIVESAQANGKDRVLAALDDIVSRIRRRLGESLDGLTRNRVPLPAATTASLEALKLYAESLRPRTAEGVSDDLLKQAITVDPNFALAHAELGRRYYLLPDHQSRMLGEEHFAKAESLLDRLSARERLWIQASRQPGARGRRIHDISRPVPRRCDGMVPAGLDLYGGAEPIRACHRRLQPRDCAQPVGIGCVHQSRLVLFGSATGTESPGAV